MGDESHFNHFKTWQMWKMLFPLLAYKKSHHKHVLVYSFYLYQKWYTEALESGFVRLMKIITTLNL